MIFFRLILIFMGIAIYHNLAAQELVTDRPDQAESAKAVPAGSLQIESGLTYEFRDHEAGDDQNITLNSTLLRIGITKGFEIRVNGEYLRNTFDPIGGFPSTTVEGFAPLSLGMKADILDENGYVPQMAVIGHITFKGIGKAEFQPDAIAPELILAFGNTINEKMALGYNFGSEWEGEAVPALFYAVALGYELSENWGCFVELFGFLEDGDQLHHIDGGITFMVQNNLQLDINGGLGINKNAPDYFLGAGLSWRIPE